MKKSALIVCLLALILICSCVFVACNKSEEEQESSNISRSVSAFYTGENENFAVSIEFGSRESVFVANGKAENVVDFVEITVIPLKTNTLTEIDYEVKGETASISGKIKNDEFGEYSANVDMNFVPLRLIVASEEIELSNILDGKLTALDIVNIAENTFKDRIATESENGNYSREIYIKLITGDRENYYYYVSYIGDGVDYWALLIKPDSGEIVSKK